MKSNYMKSAEIKIAKNPDMNWWEKSWLEFEAGQKERELQVKLGLANRVYMLADEYALNRGLRAQVHTYDDWSHDFLAYDRHPRYTTATELTREHLEHLIDNVQATTAREPIFTGTRNAFTDYYVPFEINLDRDRVVHWGE